MPSENQAEGHCRSQLTSQGVNDTITFDRRFFMKNHAYKSQYCIKLITIIVVHKDERYRRKCGTRQTDRHTHNDYHNLDFSWISRMFYATEITKKQRSNILFSQIGQVFVSLRNAFSIPRSHWSCTCRALFNKRVHAYA